MENKYIILNGISNHDLSYEINKVLELQEYELWGSPYTDGKNHYQALIKKETKQQLNG